MLSAKGNSIFAVIIVVAVLAALLGWWYWSQGVAHAPAPAQEATTTASTGSTQSAGLPSGSTADNAALGQDLTAIDGQMNGFASDNASVDGSLSDKPVQQSSL